MYMYKLERRPLSQVRREYDNTHPGNHEGQHSGEGLRPCEKRKEGVCEGSGRKWVAVSAL